MDNVKVLYDAIETAVRASNSGIGPHAPRLGTFGVGQRFMELVKKALSNLDLSMLTKEQFMSAVGMAFDNLIAPSIGPAAMFVRPLVMHLAEKFYDNRVAPKV